MQTKTRVKCSICIANVVLAVLLIPVSALAWASDGHKIVAVIAADNLTPAAQSHVASILGASSNIRSISAAMKNASTIPDSKFREDSSTWPWHYINVCLQASRTDVPASCGAKGCVTEKIDEYSKRLKEGNYDKWGAQGDLAFLIHFVGDIHQPLHAANNADEGGNCVMVDSHPQAKDLHYAWDKTIVEGLEVSIDSGTPDKTARKLEQKFATEKTADTWIPADDIAWESQQIARSDIYTALKIPIVSCKPTANGCSRVPREINPSYMDHAEEIAGHQLAKAGFRLASLLNGIWTSPVSPNDAPRAANSAPAQVVSSQTVAGKIVGNRNSKIYAWPACGTYDRMAPRNRVVFSSREAAEQAGYRAAFNCP